MRPTGSAEALAWRRQWAVSWLLDGYSPQEIADLLEVRDFSVRRWWQAHQRQGPTGLAARPVPGRPPKLSPAQTRQVLDWLDQDPRTLGLPTA